MKFWTAFIITDNVFYQRLWERDLSQIPDEETRIIVEGSRRIPKSDWPRDTPVLKLALLQFAAIIPAWLFIKAVAWSTSALLQLPKTWAALLVAVATPIIAELCYRWREHTRRVPYAMFEIALGALVAARAYYDDGKATDTPALIAVVLGIFLAVDGRARLARALGDREHAQ